MTQPLPRVKIFFFISGCAALAYEILWIRWLGLVFGNTTYAVSTVLCAYMAGLGFGSFFLGRLSESWKKPLRVYGFLEAGIGLYAAFTPLLLRLIQTVYISSAHFYEPSSPASIAIKLFLSFIVVFIPTFFMGGTLPVLMKYFVRESKNVGSSSGLLYALNTAGALTGVALSGFWLLPAIGANGLLCVAVCLNVMVGLLAVNLSTALETDAEVSTVLKNPNREKTSLFETWTLPLGLCVSGACAMIYEVGWTRILATVLSSSTYAFTLMLSSFLLGIALGSAWWKKVLDKKSATGIQWGWLQLVIAASSFAALPLFTEISFWMVRVYGLTLGYPHALFFIMSLICLVMMFIPAFCFGALFPVSSALYIRNTEDASRKIGVLYLWNTVGNITGSLAAGFILIPIFGIHKSLLIAIALGALLSGISAWVARKKPMQNSVMFVLACALLIAVSGQTAKGWDPRLVSSGLNINPSSSVGKKTGQILSGLFNHQVLFYREGLNSIVSVGQEGDNRYLKVNGKTDASTRGDISTQLLLGHLPHLLHTDPKKSLVIGFGSGMTLAAALTHNIQNADSVEIEPAVMEAAPFFEQVNRKTYLDPRAKMIINDGRNHLLMNSGTYDIVISEPSNPWMSGVSFLFTKEFYELADKRLNPGGVLCQWIHAYAMTPEDFWMVVASVRQVFEHVTLWRANEVDFLIIAGREPFRFDLDRIQARFSANEQLRKDLRLIGIESAAGLLAHFQYGEETVSKYAAQAAVNTDNFLPLEFSTPLSLYDSNEDLIKDMNQGLENEPLPPILSQDTDILKNSLFLSGLGKGYLGMRNTNMARKYFLMAGPDNTDAQTGLAKILIAENKEIQAAALLEKASGYEAFLALGELYLKQGDPKKALDTFEKAIAADSMVWEVWYRKAQALENLGRWDEAMACYRKYIQLSGETLTNRFGFAKAQRQAGHLDEAVKNLELILKDYPAYYPVYWELKEAYIAAGQLDRIIHHYENLVERNPHVEQYWVDLLGLYLKKNDQESVDFTLERMKNFDIY